MAKKKTVKKTVEEIVEASPGKGYDEGKSHREEHESFAVVSISRYTGQTELFDVSVPQNHFIGLRISRASRYRMLSKNRVHEEARLIEVHMSETQFARMLSSINSGGVPCTLASVAGETMADPPSTNLTERFRSDLKRSTEHTQGLLDDMETLLESLTETGRAPSKKTANAVLDRMRHLKMELEKNMPFVLDSAVEQLEGAVDEAKANIDAYQQHQAMRLGLDIVTATAPEIGDGSDD